MSSRISNQDQGDGCLNKKVSELFYFIHFTFLWTSSKKQKSRLENNFLNLKKPKTEFSHHFGVCVCERKKCCLLNLCF